MEVRGGGVAGGSDQADGVAARYRGAGLDSLPDLRQVRVIGLITAAMIENDQVAEAAASAGKTHVGISYGVDVGAAGGCHVDTQVVAGNVDRLNDGALRAA